MKIPPIQSTRRVPKNVRIPNPMDQGITPTEKAATARTGRIPSDTASNVPSCGPTVTGATRPSPQMPKRSQTAEIQPWDFPDKFHRNLRLSHSRRAAPGSATTAAPQVYPSQAAEAAKGTLSPSAAPAGIAARKYANPSANELPRPAADHSIAEPSQNRMDHPSPTPALTSSGRCPSFSISFAGIA